MSNLSGVAEERISFIVLDEIGNLMMLEASDIPSHEIERFVDGIVHVVG